MEKYSAYRDPGTGIQPFLPPVAPPGASDFLVKALIPVRYLVGAVRTVVVLLLLAVYLVLVSGLCTLFAPIPPVHRAIKHLFTAILSRLALLALGFFWISPEIVTRKRGRGGKTDLPWNPKAGDIIVSNSVSWIELLWLAFKYDPVFVVPVTEAPAKSTTDNTPSPISYSPGRRTGTGSANIASTRNKTERMNIKGFQPVSLLSAICLTGLVPPYPTTSSAHSLEDIRKTSERPIVVFPECTTSNGRGLLRFGDVFNQQPVPVKGYNVFVMCVRYDPPTTFSPSPSLSIHSLALNPLPHLFQLASSLSTPALSIRLLSPAESPSSGSFLASEFVSHLLPGQDQLSESCAALISQIGKLKRTGMGWEDKANFLDFYRGQRRS